MIGDTRSVLFVWSDVSGFGGTERRMVEATVVLARRGVDVHSFMLSAVEDRSLQVLQSAAGAASVANGGIRALSSFWWSVRPDAIVAFGLRPSLFTRVLRAFGRSGRPLVMAQNGLDHRASVLRRSVDRLTRSLVDGYIANSSSARALLTRRGIRAERVAVVRSAIDDRWTAPVQARSSFRRVAMIGNNRPEKNQLFGLSVFLGAKEEGTLTIFTDDAGPLRRFLEHHEENPRSHAVTFVENHRIEPQDLDSVDVLLHPSLSESLPRVILEALARGCWIIASDVGDTSAVVPQGAGKVIREFSLETYVPALESAMRRTHGADIPRNAIRTTDVYVDEFLAALSALRDRRPLDGSLVS